MSMMENENRETIHQEGAANQDLIDLFSWYVKGAERVAEVQKNIIDIAVQQNSEMLNIWKRMTEKLPGTVRPLTPDLAVNAIERLGETQKGVIDLMLEQTRVMTNLAQERSTAAKKATEGASNMVQQAVERSVAAQKKVLENSAAQTKAVFDTARQQFGFNSGPAEEAAHTFQRGLDAVVEAQKEMLDLVTR